ncbi:recombinase family protein [Deinococcus oregonensis]|uniref:Recombinase family protein n=1 Tax=Deinococcus oregonensis TaxID=1805970 RepID=A0ABV6AVW8_9DEIO
MITPLHRSQEAAPYLRQSSKKQAKHNTGSRELQRALVQNALDLGWSLDRITMYEDGGRSAAFRSEREKFDQLIDEIRTGHIGLVLITDPSRGARNLEDWGKLIEMLRLTGTLIHSHGTLYDPRLLEDEAELNWAYQECHEAYRERHQRTQESALALAREGKLRLPLPIGYLYDHKDVVFDPRPGVKAAIEQIFKDFDRVGVMLALLREYSQKGILVPKNKSPGHLVWEAPTLHYFSRLIHHPAYAGIYVYGQSKQVATINKAGERSVRTQRLSRPEAAQVFRHTTYPAYISYDRHLKNRQTLDGNRIRIDSHVPRNGVALLHGLTVCGYCGAKMSVNYSRRRQPAYTCQALCRAGQGPTCQWVQHHIIEDPVLQLVLDALAPAQIDLTLRVHEQEQHAATAALKSAGQQLEAAAADLKRARDLSVAAIERNAHPDVVQYLNQRLEIAKTHHLQANRRHATLHQDSAVHNVEEVAKRIQQLDLDKIFKEMQTTPRVAKQVLDCLIKQLEVKRDDAVVHLVVTWHTGQTTSVTIPVVRRPHGTSVRGSQS